MSVGQFGHLEKRYVTNILLQSKISCALQETIIVEVSWHIRKHVNIISVFHDVKLVLYMVSNIYPKAGILLKGIKVFCR